MKGPWTTPFERVVQPGLRGAMVQHADGHSTTLRPRRFHGVTPPPSEEEGPVPMLVPEPPVCIPPSFDGGGWNIDPLKDPYEVGDVIDISLISPPTGTTPITYEWFVNGFVRGTSETFSYTVSAEDVTGLEAEFGTINLWVKITNACGSATFDTVTINVFVPAEE